MTWWIIEKSVGFTDVGLLKISESVRAYTYLILSSQASTKCGIVDNTVSPLTAQSASLDNFENIVNCRVDIREVIKHYQDTLSYTSTILDKIVWQNSDSLALQVHFFYYFYQTVDICYLKKTLKTPLPNISVASVSLLLGLEMSHIFQQH